MKKIFWSVTSVLAGFISGMFIYEGGKLFFWYADRRQGLLVMAAGAAAAVLYIWAVCQLIVLPKRADIDTETPEKAEAKDHQLMEFLMTVISFGCASAGVILYITRFHTLAESLFSAAAVMVITVAAAAVGAAVNGRR